MESAIPSTLAEWVAAAFVGISGIVIGIQLLLKSFNSNSTESALLKMMHEELERMSSQNATLSAEIGKLQLELIKLSSQLTTLTIENQKLQSEVSNLNKEIIRLHGFITERKSI